MIYTVPVKGVFETNCYFCIDEATKHGFLIDPGAQRALRKTLCKRYSTKSALMLRFGTLCALISLGHPRSSRGRQYARA
jgi:hypothetical protein